MILYPWAINRMTNNTIVKNLEEIMKGLNDTINLCKESQIDTPVSDNNTIQAMVLFRTWRPCEDAFENHIEEEMIAFFPSEEKAREIANRWVKTQKEKVSHSNWNRFTAFIIPVNKKFNGKRITGKHSSFEVGDHF